MREIKVRRSANESTIRRTGLARWHLNEITRFERVHRNIDDALASIIDRHLARDCGHDRQQQFDLFARATLSPVLHESAD